MKEKIKKAAALLLFKRHKYPGAKEWELKKYLGEHYEEILKILEEQLEPLGLGIKVVIDDGSKHYSVIIKDKKLAKDLRTFGWRIDEMAVLAVALSYILARGGGVPEKELVNLISEKIARWRIEHAIEKFVRLGYLDRENDVIKIGLRSKIEFDLEKLIRLFIGTESSSEISQANVHSQHQE